MELFNTFISERSIQLVEETLRSGYINQGKRVDEFESRLRDELHFTNPVTLNSCTSSLHLALILSDIKKGDEIILSPQTFIATGLAVLMAGGTPVFADVDSNGNICPNSIELKITPKTKAVIVVHWGGIPAQMKLIEKAVSPETSGISIIEDAAHAMGATYNGSVIGDCKYSRFCCFSLQAIKTLTTGDGGILCCKSSTDYENAIKMRWFGMDKKAVQRGPNGERLSKVETLGYKYHMNDIAASIGLGNLDSLKTRVNISRSWANIYFERLHDYTYYLLPDTTNRLDPSYWFFPMTHPRRNEIVNRLKEKGIPASTIDRRIDKHPIFAPYYEFLANVLVFDSIQFAIPCHAGLTTENVLYITDSLKEILNDYSG